MPTKRGYARRGLGGGHVLKVVTRTRREHGGRPLGRAPGKQPGPPVWRAHLRRLQEATIERLEEIEEGSSADVR